MSHAASLTLAFASPILRIQVSDADTLNAKLVQEVHAIRAQSPGITVSNRRGWHSESDLMTRREPGLAQLARIIRNAMETGTQAISPAFDPTQCRLEASGWININPQHGYNIPHRHLGFVWSGCYYVTVPDAEEAPSGSIEFLSPFVVSEPYKTLGANCYHDKITMRPKPGDMLLFPSYLTHWVYPNDAAEERITIAFNGTYLPK